MWANPRAVAGVDPAKSRQRRETTFHISGDSEWWHDPEFSAREYFQTFYWNAGILPHAKADPARSRRPGPEGTLRGGTECCRAVRRPLSPRPG